MTPLGTTALLGLLALMPAAHAVTYTDRTAWEGSVATWADVDDTQWPAGYTPFAAGTPITLPLSGVQVEFDKLLFGAQVPTDWTTWSGGNTPRILVLLGNLASGDSVGATANGIIESFGVELQPNLQAVFQMTLVNGSIISQQVDGSSGAKFFGWSQEPVVSFSMSIESQNFNGLNATGFGFGRMVEGTGAPVPHVPDGGSILLTTGLTFLGMMGAARRRRN